MLFNYRGYGKSKGVVSLAHIAEDARYCISFLKECLAVKRLTLYGRSLGGYAASSNAS
jgi:pimeloyl-ACP methyl ester carboxylesterase